MRRGIFNFSTRYRRIKQQKNSCARVFESEIFNEIHHVGVLNRRFGATPAEEGNPASVQEDKQRNEVDCAPRK